MESEGEGENLSSITVRKPDKHNRGQMIKVNVKSESHVDNM